jgi:ElaB/YqjD/DUF883 family membrane-anchored ribosome-binding protein
MTHHGYAARRSFMQARELNADLDHLKEEVDRLRKETESLRREVQRKPAEALSESDGEKERSFLEAVRAIVKGVREQSRKSLTAVEEKVERHPLAGLLAALGIGFLLGKILERK